MGAPSLEKLAQDVTGFGVNRKIECPAGEFQTRPLGPPDMQTMQALFESCTDYFEATTGAAPQPDEAQRALVAGPPQKPVADKRVIGVFDAEGGLVGVIDSIIDWPDPGVWTMGMLLLDPKFRRQGLGVAALDAFEHWSQGSGAMRIRTAVVSGQAEGLGFLNARGYAEETRMKVKLGDRGAEIVFLTKDL